MINNYLGKQPAGESENIFALLLRRREGWIFAGCSLCAWFYR